MLYQTFMTHFRDTVSAQSNLKMADSPNTKKDSLQRIKPMKSVTKVDSISLSMSESDFKEGEGLLDGMSPLSDMVLFTKDPNGFPTLKDYMIKLIDSVYQYSMISYEERKKLGIISRLAVRRRMFDKLKGVMPMYVKRLQDVEKSVIKKYDIPSDEIEKLVLNSSGSASQIRIPNQL